MGEGAYANCFCARVGIGRIMFLDRFPVKRYVYKGLDFRASRFLGCVILNAGAFKRAIMKGVKGNVRRVLRIINDLIRINLRYFVTLLCLNCANFYGFDFFLFTFFRRLASHFQG